MSKFSIGFAGDFSFSGHFKGLDKGHQVISSEIKAFLDSNDTNVINFESPITPCRKTRKLRLAHRCSPEVLDYVIENINNPILSIANNHMMDYNVNGMVDSIESIESKGLQFIGAGRSYAEAAKSVIVGNDEVKIGIVALQYKEYKERNGRYVGPMSEGRDKHIRKSIESIRDKVDWVVVVYHGGEEFLNAPMPYTRKLLKKYLNWGADVVVAHHPHVVQGYEYYGKKAVFYSLGNFIFDTDYQRRQNGTDAGMLLSLTFSKDGFEFSNLATHLDRSKMEVGVGEESPAFINVKKHYGRLWKKAASAKKGIMAAAKDLKEEELNSRAEEAVNKYIQQLGLLKSVNLKTAINEIKKENPSFGQGHDTLDLLWLNSAVENEFKDDLKAEKQKALNDDIQVNNARLDTYYQIKEWIDISKLIEEESFKEKLLKIAMKRDNIGYGYQLFNFLAKQCQIQGGHRRVVPKNLDLVLNANNIKAGKSKAIKKAIRKVLVALEPKTLNKTIVLKYGGIVGKVYK